MNPVEGFAIFAGGAAFLALILVISYYQKKAADQRRAELAALAASLGLEFYPYGLGEVERGFWQGLFTQFGDTNLGRFLDRFQGFTPFGQGHSWSVSNLIVGRKDGLDWYAFDYLYKTTQSTGKSTQTVPHPTGVVAVRIPMTLPSLTLSPENVLHRVGSFLGMKELTFELEEFNRRYFIQCSDRKVAYDLLHPQTIEYLMSLPVRSWQMAGFYVVLTDSSYYSTADVPKLMEEIQGFIGQIPEYVHQDAGFVGKWTSALD